MSEFLPKDVREGLEQARKHKLRKKSRLRVKAGDQTFTILRYWDEGFALDADDAPHLRGLVDVFDGARHLSQCLIVASEEESGEMGFEFKRATPDAERPAVDYEVLEGPVGLIELRNAKLENTRNPKIACVRVLSNCPTFADDAWQKLQ